MLNEPEKYTGVSPCPVLKLSAFPETLKRSATDEFTSAEFKPMISRDMA